MLLSAEHPWPKFTFWATLAGLLHLALVVALALAGAVVPGLAGADFLKTPVIHLSLSWLDMILDKRTWPGK